MRFDRVAPLMLNAANLVYRQPFLRLARSPRRAQEAALAKILRANTATTFGRDHGFAGLQSCEDFRAAVPVQTHDSLAAAIRQQALTGAATLTCEPPLFYARTSGTTGAARDFPVTAASMKAQKCAQRILAATLHRGSAFFRGRVAGFSGAYVEGQLSSGQPFGSASGQTYATAPGFVRRRFAVPAKAFDIVDPLEKYHAYALWALAADDLTGMIAANPSTIGSLLRHIRRHGDRLLRDLSDGTFTIGPMPSPAVQEAMAAALPRPDRARCLSRALGQDLRLDAIWPKLSALVTWTGGNCRTAVDQLAPMMPPHLRVIEIGYRASELVGTINVDADSNLCLPDLRHTVFEFVEQSCWERGEAKFLWLDEIEEGRSYYVFVTTPGGLYRYHINDLLEVSGRHGACPGLRFVQKGQGVTSITGEKVHEIQVIKAARQARAAAGLPAGFFVALADPNRALYTLYQEVEADPAAGLAAQAAKAFDDALTTLNIEYAAKRCSGRLEAARAAFLLPGTGEAFKCHSVARGQREAQFKPPALADTGRWTFDLGPHLWEPAR